MSSRVLTESIRTLGGVGDRRAEVLEAHGVTTLNDLVTWYPRKYLDRTNVVSIGKIRGAMEAVTVVGTVNAKRSIPGRKGGRFELVVADASGEQ